MTISRQAFICVAAIFALCGCGTDYAWRSSVPRGLRTVSVPTFRNESNVQEAGAVAARQVLREFQREGTFAVRGPDDAALQIQGTVVSAGGSVTSYNRRHALRIVGADMVVEAVVSVIDKRSGKVVVDNRKYVASASFASSEDFMTSQRDATGRAMEDLARQIVDDVLLLKL